MRMKRAPTLQPKPFPTLLAAPASRPMCFVNRDWQGMFDITYEDVQWVATGEWLTKETWEKYSREQPGGSVNHHYVKEEWMKTALQWPRMMVATDALPAVNLADQNEP